MLTAKGLLSARPRHGTTLEPESRWNLLDPDVLAWQFKGAPEVEAMSILQARDGSLSLPASAAALHGNTLQYEAGGGHDNVGYWTDPGDWADWEMKATKPGRFAVSATIALSSSPDDTTSSTSRV